MALHVSTLKELQDALKGNHVVVIKVGATWCPPCQKVQPLYEAEAKHASTWKALVYDIEKTTARDTDPIMQACRVTKIPHFAVFKVCSSRFACFLTCLLSYLLAFLLACFLTCLLVLLLYRTKHWWLLSKHPASTT